MSIGTPTVVDSGTTSANTNDPTVVAMGLGFAPAVDDILVVFFRATRGSSTMTGTPSLAHAAFSGGFTLRASVVVADGTNRSRLMVFTGRADGTTSDQIDTLTGETANNTSRHLMAVKIPGAHLTTPMPSGQSGQQNEANTTDGTITPSLPSAPAGTSITLAAIAVNDATPTEPTVPSGWTKLGSFLTEINPTGGMLVAYKNPGEQNAAFTGAESASTTTDLASVIIEIQEEPASGGGIVVKVLQAHGG
ncbi:MAG: hypothetical protein IT352_07475 [Gemmatimonadales bacterium]|nr:hypothetical protein [Gemmatimonadales bacterium]